MSEVLAAYGTALLTAQPLSIIATDGRHIGLDVERWLACVDAADETVLARCRPPVLDVGCGPGRFVAALNERGRPALGVDIADTAIALARRRGASAVVRNAFADLPGEGRWPTVLLMDGNIGIGGDPARLLRRMRALLAAGGRMIIETDVDPSRDELLDVRLARGGEPVGHPFPWAIVGIDALSAYAASVGVCVTEQWCAGGRSFALLTGDGRARL